MEIDPIDAMFRDADEALNDLITATSLLIAIERIESYFRQFALRKSGQHFTTAHFQLIEIHRRLNLYINEKLDRLAEFRDLKGGNNA